MKNVVSIDFGTSNSTVCWTNPKTGLPEVIKDRNGSEKIPSVVYWGAGDEVLVGEAAINRLTDAQHDEAESIDAMQRIVKSVKRALRHNQAHVLPDGRLVKPVETVAMILGYLKNLAETTAFHESVDSVVLTHPVMMTQREKELLNEAARKAGFATVLFKEEPVAAALGYLANGAKVGSGILIFDLGGGTLDLAYLQKAADGSYRMPVECMGDAECGGDDYDQIIYDHWEAQMQAQYGRGFADKAGEINPFILLECRKAKEKLTDQLTARMSFFFRKDGHHEQASFALTREEFESRSKGYVEKAVGKTGQMLDVIRNSGFKVDTVLLIGGTTRMLMLREALKATLPVAPIETMYADVAVALGASQKTKPVPLPKPVPTPTPKPQEPKSINSSGKVWLFISVVFLAGSIAFSVHQNQVAEAERQAEAARVAEVARQEAVKQAEADRRASVNAPPFGRNFTVSQCQIEMVWISAGRLIMGSPGGESGRGDDELQHRVEITKGFWIGKYEITQEQWMDVMGYNCSMKGNGGNYPAESMSWNDAMEFCETLTKHERAAGRMPQGYEYTLPTEAQWEYACRAGTTGPYAGSGGLDSMGWYEDNSGGNTHPVGQKQANTWGLYDMHGNVWEWCNDWYGSYPSGSVTDPTGANTGSLRVGRGGGWFSHALRCRSAFRCVGDPGVRDFVLGFRLALSSVK